ncbi:hypothetical protein LINPERHAP1_LOCUS27597, partial [Linum perenne]
SFPIHNFPQTLLHSPHPHNPIFRSTFHIPQIEIQRLLLRMKCCLLKSEMHGCRDGLELERVASSITEGAIVAACDGVLVNVL